MKNILNKNEMGKIKRISLFFEKIRSEDNTRGFTDKKMNKMRSKLEYIYSLTWKFRQELDDINNLRQLEIIFRIFTEYYELVFKSKSYYNYHLSMFLQTIKDSRLVSKMDNRTKPENIIKNGVIAKTKCNFYSLVLIDDEIKIIDKHGYKMEGITFKIPDLDTRIIKPSQRAKFKKMIKYIEVNHTEKTMIEDSKERQKVARYIQDLSDYLKLFNKEVNSKKDLKDIELIFNTIVKNAPLVVNWDENLMPTLLVKLIRYGELKGDEKHYKYIIPSRVISTSASDNKKLLIKNGLALVA